MNRRQFLLGLGAGVIALPTYTFGSEPRWLEVNSKSVYLNNWSSSSTIRLLHLSDLHASLFVSWSMIEHAVALGLSQKPDLICLTGDFVTGKVNDLNRLTEVLSPLSKSTPVFACLGNHDGGRWVKKYNGYTTTAPVKHALVTAGIICLENDARHIVVNDQPLNLVGFGDLYNGDFKPQYAFPKVDQETLDDPVILLAHNPDCKKGLAAWRWDLMLCGHTHGGQVKIPFYGAPILPIDDKRFAEGLIRWEGRFVHVTRGVGNLGGFRFNCPPEMNILELSEGKNLVTK